MKKTGEKKVSEALPALQLIANITGLRLNRLNEFKAIVNTSEILEIIAQQNMFDINMVSKTGKTGTEIAYDLFKNSIKFN